MNTAGRGANQGTATTLTRGRANGRDTVWACGKAAPLETSSPKTAQQIVRRMRHPPREALAIVIVRRDRMPSTPRTVVLTSFVNMNSFLVALVELNQVGSES